MFHIKQNDTSPALRAELKDADDNAVDVREASVEFHMRPVGGTTAVVSAPGSVIDGVNGIVEYSWVNGDTSTVGNYEAEFQVTFANSKIETFPNSRYIKVKIVPEID